MPSNLEDVIVIINCAVIVDIVVIVVNVGAIHQRINVIWSQLDRLVQIGQGSGVVFLHHIGIGAVVIGFGKVGIKFKRTRVICNRGITIAAFVVIVTLGKII